MEGRVVSMDQSFQGNVRILKARRAKVLIETVIEGYGIVQHDSRSQDWLDVFHARCDAAPVQCSVCDLARQALLPQSDMRSSPKGFSAKHEVLRRLGAHQW